MEKKKRRLLKYLLPGLGIVIILLVLLYNVLLSSAALRGVVLPLLSDLTGITFEADAVSLSLLRGRVEITGVRVGSAKNPFATVKTLKGEVRLSDIIAGYYHFRNVQLIGADIRVEHDGKGNLNLFDREPANAAAEKAEKAPSPPKKRAVETTAKPSKPDEPLQFDFQNVNIKDSKFTVISNAKGSVSTLEISGLNISVTRFANRKAGKLKLEGLLRISSGNDIKISGGKWKMGIDAQFDKNLFPVKCNLMSNLSGFKGSVSDKNIGGSNLAILLNADSDNDALKVRNLLVRQVRNGNILTNIQAKAALRYQPFNLDAELKVAPLSEEIFSVVANFFKGVNPGHVKMKYNGRVTGDAAGLASNGKLSAMRRGAAFIGGKKFAIPAFSVEAGYDFKYSYRDSGLTVAALKATVTENSRNVAALTVKKPFRMLLAGQSIMFKDNPPVVDLFLNRFDLKTIQLFIPPDSGFQLENGYLDAALTCSVNAPGDGLRIKGRTAGRELNFSIGKSRVRNVKFTEELDCSLTDKFRKIKTDRLLINLESDGMRLAGLALRGSYDFAAAAGDVEATLSGLGKRGETFLPLSAGNKKTLEEALNKLDEFKLDLTARARLDLKKDIVALKECRLRMQQEQRDVITLSLTPQQLNLSAGMPKKLKLKLKTDRLGLRQLNGFIGSDTFKINSGALDLKSEIALSKKQLTLNGSGKTHQLTLQNGGEIIKNITLSFNTAADLKKYRALNVSNLKIDAFVGSTAVLRFAGVGKMDFQAGNGKFSTRFGLNNLFLNILKPNEFTSANVQGSLSLELGEKLKSFQVKGKVGIADLLAHSVGTPINGELVVNLLKTPDSFRCKRIYGDLRKGREHAVLFTVSSNFPGETSRRDNVIKLSSEKIDLQLIEQLLNPKGRKAANPEKPRRQIFPQRKKDAGAPPKQKPLSFDLGPRKYVINADLRGITYGPKIKSVIKGVVIGHGKRLTARPMNVIVNGSLLRLDGELVSKPAGIDYQLKGNLDSLLLAPLFQPFFKDVSGDSKGTMKNFAMNVRGSGLRTPQFWDNMQGDAHAEFANLMIPNEFSKTLLGKIFLAPFLVLGEIQRQLPGYSKPKKAASKDFDYIKEFEENTRLIKLEKGVVNLQAKDGRINIKTFDFSGDFIKQLKFEGFLGLGTDRRLRLGTSLNLAHVVLPVVIRGTVDDPKINYRTILMRFITANTNQLLSITGVGKALETNPRVKKTEEKIKNVINQTLDTLTGKRETTSAPDNANQTEKKKTPSWQKILNNVLEE